MKKIYILLVVLLAVACGHKQEVVVPTLVPLPTAFPPTPTPEPIDWWSYTSVFESMTFEEQVELCIKWYMRPFNPPDGFPKTLGFLDIGDGVLGEMIVSDGIVHISLKELLKSPELVHPITKVTRTDFYFRADLVAQTYPDITIKNQEIEAWMVYDGTRPQMGIVATPLDSDAYIYVLFAADVVPVFPVPCQQIIPPEQPNSALA